MRCVVIRYDHPVDRTVALGLIYGRGSSWAQRPGSDDCEGKRKRRGGVVIQLCLHIPLSRAARRANHPAKLNEHSLMKSVCIFIFLWGTNNGVSARVRMQTCYAQLMTVVAVLWVMFIVVDICLPIRRPLYVFVFHFDGVHAIQCWNIQRSIGVRITVSHVKDLLTISVILQKQTGICILLSCLW